MNGIFGVRGEVRLWLHNPDSDWLAVEREVVLRAPNGARQTVRMQARSGAGARILATISGVEDRDLARSFIDWEILAPRQALPRPVPGEWYISDLLGLPVATDQGRPLGRLWEVHQEGTVDVWEVRAEAGGVTFIPVLAAHILEVGPDRILVSHLGVVETDPVETDPPEE